VAPDTTKVDGSRLGWGAEVTLLALAVALVLTDSRFTFIDDEASIVSAAAQPAARILGFYLHGYGMHMHPPLFDLLLHGWLRLTGERLWALRLPSIFFYVLGLWILAQVCVRLAGGRAGRMLIWIGVLWPYGFHYGRLAAWYSLCFLLVGLVTLCYLRVLESRRPLDWVLFFLAGLALVWANYFGWAVWACLGFDLFRRRRQDPGLRLRPWFLATALLAAAYLPVARGLASSLGTVAGAATHSWVSRGLYAGYALYVVGVSESMAPWFWRLGVPAAAAVASCLLTLSVVSQPGRRFFAYFCALFGVMALLSILTTKRLMLIAPWLLLPAATLLASREPSSRLARRVLAGALLVIAAIGWLGILTRSRYAAPRFLEPWSAVAHEAALELRQGNIVIGNSANPSFLFYLGHAVAAENRSQALLLQPQLYPGVYDASEWLAAGRPVRPGVLLVKGVPMYGRKDPVWAAERWLDSHCGLVNDRKYLPDPGYALKQRFFPQLGELPWRVEVRRYACSPAS
jgi:Dolichyl-phosphate-mannose-protein mannosyltransferase